MKEDVLKGYKVGADDYLKKPFDSDVLLFKIKAILFGSIGTIVETSEIQRVAFNKAFKISGLNWYWSKVQYQKFLKKPGGEKRIKKYAKSKKKLVNSLKIRNLKTRLFNNYIIKNKLKPRKGIIKLIKECKRYNINSS